MKFIVEFKSLMKHYMVNFSSAVQYIVNNDHLFHQRLSTFSLLLKLGEKHSLSVSL